jgi:fumarylacetoacetate (FAA) hydrolase family protein
MTSDTEDAVPYLAAGLTNAEKLAEDLIEVGLWERVEPDIQGPDGGARMFVGASRKRFEARFRSQ